MPPSGWRVARRTSGGRVKIRDLYTHLLSSGVIKGLNKNGKRSKIDESCPTFSETGIFLSLRLEHLLMA